MMSVARALLLAACLLPSRLLGGEHLDPGKLAEMEAAIRLAIADGRLPGAVLWVESKGENHQVAVGNRAVEPQAEPNAADTIYDAASLTKVIATTSAVMLLIERGQLDVDAAASRYLSELTGDGRESITVRQLLTHTSGTKPGIPSSGWEGVDEAIKRATTQPLAAKPGETFRYSDVNFIVLGEIVRRVSGKPLDEFTASEIFRPLKMSDTGFRPAAELRSRIAPTTRDRERGVVHDPTAKSMGGVAGHAGLFTTAADLARFARMLLRGGELEGVRIFKPETVRLMTSVQSPAELGPRRGLGWDIDTSFSGPRGKWFPIGSFGHTGWTGTSLWIDPFSQSFVVFLSNRNHPTEKGNVIPLRSALGSLAAEAVRTFNFVHVQGALPPRAGITPRVSERTPQAGNVLTGIDVLVRDDFAALRGLRVGLITNHTGIDRQRRRTIDLLAKAPGVTLAALFGPEHGIAGKLDAKFGDTREEKTNLPIYSLYGEKRAPTAEQLAGLDALVFDIQDIGCRFYTYISTLGECLTAAGNAKIKFFVLDRPNAIGGSVVEGPLLGSQRSFTAWHELPLRHGMTVGELAKMYNAERNIGAELTVIPCEGWDREAWFDETGLPWVNPSPNMRSITAAGLYPGVGMIEFCNISVGRGTDRPFEFVGAPYIDDRRFADALNAAGLPGVRFVATRFTPTAYIFSGQECGGVQIVVTDRWRMNAVDIGLELARTLHRLHAKEWKPERLTKLLADPATEKAVTELREISAMRVGWVAGREEFARRRGQFLLYK